MSKWVKGQSGNLTGRPKTAFKENFDQLKAKIKMQDEGSQIVAEEWADIISGMVYQAKVGNVQAAIFLRDTFLGKPKETVVHDIDENAKEGLRLAYSIGD
jgi:hypothetical protein